MNTPKDMFWPNSLAAWATVLTVIFSAGFAILTFYRNNRIKAAELVLSVQREFSAHLKTLRCIEYLKHYESVYLPALYKALQVETDYESEEREAVDDLEGVLRYFHVCWSLRRLRVDARAMDQLCAYYLRLFCNRPELREYMRRYWPEVYFWAMLIGEPWPKRVVFYCLQIPARLATWWRGTYPKS